MAERARPVSAPTPRVSSENADASTARVVLPVERFALAGLFERVPDARVECEPTVANATDHALLVVRADDDRGAVGTGLESARGVGTVEFLGDRDDGWAYRVTWEGRPRRLIRDLVAAGVTILSMGGQDGEWNLRLLAEDRTGIARADELMADFDCGAEYLRISALDGASNGSGLTDEQREALLTAFEEGYYDIPRDATAEDVAAELGITHQALSERFRRAYRQVVKNELAVGERRP